MKFRNPLTRDLLVYFLFLNAAAFSDSYQQVCEKKVERKIELTASGPPCAVTVKKSEDGFSKDHVLWSAQNQPGYCPEKFQFHLKNMAKLGWTCADGNCWVKDKREVRIEWSNHPSQLPCEVRVENKRYWWAKNQKAFCIGKYEAYLSQLKKQGWEFQETVQVVEAPKEIKEVEEIKPQTTLESIPASKEPWAELVPKVGLHFDRMDASDRNGGSAVIYSRGLNATAEVALNKRLANSMAGYLLFSGSHVRLQVNKKADRLLGSDGFLFRGGLGTVWEPVSGWTTGLEADSSQQLFVLRTAVTTLSLEKIWIPEMNIFSRYRLIESNKRAMGPEVSLGYLFPAETQTIRAMSGYSYRLGIWGEFEDWGLPIKASLYFQRRFQNTSLLDWNTRELGIQLSVDLNLV